MNDLKDTGDITFLIPKIPSLPIKVAGWGASFASLTACMMQGWSLSSPLELITLGIAFVIMFGWIRLMQHNHIELIDPVIAHSFLGAGLALTACARLLPQNLMAATIIALLVISASLLFIIWLKERRTPLPEPEGLGGYSEELVKSPLVYLYVYAVVIGISLGFLSMFIPERSDYHLMLGLGLGMILASICMYVLMASMKAARGLELITRISLVTLCTGIISSLHPEFQLFAHTLTMCGVTLVIFQLIHMSVDLYTTFSISRTLPGVTFLLFSASTGLGIVLSWLFKEANLFTYGSTVIGGASVLLIVLITTFGLDSNRMWTASSLRHIADDDHPEEEQVTDKDEDVQQPGSWKRACMSIAETYQLTPREEEVFALLARGRNTAYIEGELVISSHTVKTHTLNIYRKLDVHSLQEVIDLVENTRKII